MTDLRQHIANVLTDYRDGLGDGIEDAVDAILDHPEIKDARRLRPVGTLGHSIKVNPPR